MADAKCGNYIEQHTNKANALRRNAQQPIFSTIEFWRDKLKVQNIDKGKDQTQQHTGNSTLFIDPFTKDTQHNGGE